MIGTLKRQSQRWAERHPELIRAEQDKSTGAINIFLMPDDPEPLGRVAITIGETIYNLRSALDYIVYDLARIAQGAPVAGTQFPIEESSAVFESRITGKTKGKPTGHFLKGVPASAVSLIRELQPFEGCTWTRELRELSNPDKHRHLSSIRGNVAATIKEAELVDVDSETGKGSVRFRYDAEVELLLADGRPIQETLQALCSEVAATVELFKSRIGSR